MIFEKECLSMQVSSLLAAYPGLKLVENNSDCIRFQGSILVNRIDHGFTVRKFFDVQIVVPLKNDESPYVIDFNNQVEYTYHHRYTNGILCLATDTDIRLRFLDSFDLVTWMEEYVETYYFSYQYYSRYGEMPFGERSHDHVGILESYRDIFKSDNGSEALRIMVSIVTRPYRGHQPCPCSSGRKIRNCHGEIMLDFYNDDRKLRILRDDVMRCYIAMKKE